MFWCHVNCMNDKKLVTQGLSIISNQFLVNFQHHYISRICLTLHVNILSYFAILWMPLQFTIFNKKFDYHSKFIESLHIRCTQKVFKLLSSWHNFGIFLSLIVQLNSLYNALVTSWCNSFSFCLTFNQGLSRKNK